MFTKHHAMFRPQRSLFGRVSKIISRKRHESPRKVSSKTESFGWILKIPSRKRREKYNACIGEIPTLKTNFFFLDPPNICSRNTTQSVVQNGVRFVGFQK